MAAFGKAPVLLVLAVTAVTALVSAEAADLSPELTALLHDILPPDASSGSPNASTITNTASVILQEEHLMGGNRPMIKSNDLIEQYTKAFALGNRGPQFATQMAEVHNALASGNVKLAKEAIRRLWQAAGRAEPDNDTLSQLLEKVGKITNAGDPVERISISKPEHSIEITWDKASGRVKVEVTDNKPPDGKPNRTVFEGQATTRPDASGKGLETVGQPKRDQLREVAEQRSQNLREKIGGMWRDQDGLTWLISGGKSTGISATQYYSSGHKVVYDGDYKLAKISASHTIKDPKDIREGFPETIKQQIATKYQPPYKIRLDVNDAGDRMEGTWISRHVTYSGLSLEVEEVSRDDFYVPLTLTRAVLSGTALGMKEGDLP